MKRASRPLLGTLALASFISGCGALSRVIQPLGPPPSPVARKTPPLAPGEVAVTWLGAAGALVRGRNVTIAFDPYVSRQNSLVHLVAGNLRPDVDEVNRYLPHVDLVLIGHAHADHILDAPVIARRDGAQVVGNLTAVNIARSYGVPPAQLHAMGGGDTLSIGGTMVSATRMDHLSLPLIKKPGYGVMHHVDGAPLHADQFKDGGALMWRVVVDGVRVGHLSSPALPRHLPDNLDVDILLLSMTGTDAVTPATAILQKSRPLFVVPIHWDLFFVPQAWDVSVRLGLLKGRTLDAVTKASRDIPTQVVLGDPMQELVFNVKNRTWR